MPRGVDIYQLRTDLRELRRPRKTADDIVPYVDVPSRDPSAMSVTLPPSGSAVERLFQQAEGLASAEAVTTTRRGR
jgi:hypothetical protein